MGYAPPGTNPTELIALAAGSRAARLRLGLGGGVVGHGRRHRALAGSARTTSTIKLGAGIMQIPARTPAMTAMTAATLDLMSGGRFLLGLGTSGPQVAEGWHGQPFGKPLAAHPRVRRDRPRRDRPRRWSSTTATTTRSPTPAQTRPGSASR